MKRQVAEVVQVEDCGSNSALDQRIITAIVSEEQLLLRELYRGGLSGEDVRTRAEQIGLTREFVRRCRLAGSSPAMRLCMKCDTMFLSAGMHNRICRGCNNRS